MIVCYLIDVSIFFIKKSVCRIIEMVFCFDTNRSRTEHKNMLEINSSRKQHLIFISSNYNFEQCLKWSVRNLNIIRTDLSAPKIGPIFVIWTIDIRYDHLHHRNKIFLC